MGSRFRGITRYFPDLLNVQDAARESGVVRLALVGGAVRDALLHHQHQDSWQGLPDIDLVVEGSAEALAQHLLQRCGAERCPAAGAWQLRNGGVDAGWGAAGFGRGSSGALSAPDSIPWWSRACWSLIWLGAISQSMHSLSSAQRGGA